MNRTLHLWVVLLAAILSSPGNLAAQSSHRDVVPNAKNTKIVAYIDESWNTLSRSMSDCKSLVDPKVKTAPVLYLPAGMPIPAAVATAHRQCNVEVLHLPRKITHIGEVRVSEIPVEGLLYLPYRYVVPGGRFNEM
jgi:alpha,alpha-trehalase